MYQRFKDNAHKWETWETLKQISSQTFSTENGQCILQRGYNPWQSNFTFPTQKFFWLVCQPMTWICEEETKNVDEASLDKETCSKIKSLTGLNVKLKKFPSVLLLWIKSKSRSRSSLNESSASTESKVCLPNYWTLSHFSPFQKFSWWQSQYILRGSLFVYYVASNIMIGIWILLLSQNWMETFFLEHSSD